MRAYICSDHIAPKYALLAEPVLPSFAVYKRLTTSGLARESPYIYSPDFPFFMGLFKGLRGGLGRGFSRE